MRSASDSKDGSCARVFALVWQRPERSLAFGRSATALQAHYRFRGRTIQSRAGRAAVLPSRESYADQRRTRRTNKRQSRSGFLRTLGAFFWTSGRRGTLSRGAFYWTHDRLHRNSFCVCGNWSNLAVDKVTDATKVCRALRSRRIRFSLVDGHPACWVRLSDVADNRSKFPIIRKLRNRRLHRWWWTASDARWWTTSDGLKKYFSGVPR